MTDNRVFSTLFKAGRRTYFFDLKKTKTNEPFITITESKKITNEDDGSFTFEKHRIFLYSKDFEKFVEALNQTLENARDVEE